MKADLVKELEKSLSKRKSDDKKNDVLDEVKGFLEYDTLRDIHMLRSIGQQSTLVQSENERGAVMEIEKKEQFYSGKVFTREQIISLAVKYRLKFLKSKHYTKYIPPSVIPEIKDMERHISNQMNISRAEKENCTIEEYIEKTNGGAKYTIDDNCLKENFFILAPANMFKTEKTTAFTIKAKDPVMFYSDDNQHFRLVKKWGSDFTIFRRFLGWSTKTVFRHIFSMYLAPIIILSLLLSLKFGWAFMFIPLAILVITGLVFIIGGSDIEVDDDFSGKEHVTSLKRFYL